MKKIGIIGAMSVEVELLRNEMNNVSTHKIGRLEFWDGLIGGVSVVVVKSGVGKVNAALCTQMLIDRFAVTHVINTGVAGAFASGLDVLDIVISTEVMYHDVDVTAWEGYEPCTLPGMEKTFVADSVLVDIGYKACEECFPEKTFIKGRIASGDQFIASDSLKKVIKEKCDPACVEMEGASVAVVCDAFGVPFCIFRSISDSADGNADVSFDEFLESAAKTSAQFTLQMLKGLGYKLAL